ncbi:hypothetical protein ACFXKF_04035 [Streptomyces scopuliridis]|uniref:hypothetical protein n=1 Tax=Streptomyces scopuliridis TaxID=452529 RepID=UPI003680A70F
MTSNVTAESLFAEYAEPIASSVGLTATEYDRTEEGLASLLCDTANRLSPLDQTGEWLEEAASDLDAIARLGSANKKTQRLFTRIDRALYDAKSELEVV